MRIALFNYILFRKELFVQMIFCRFLLETLNILVPIGLNILVLLGLSEFLSDEVCTGYKVKHPESAGIGVCHNLMFRIHPCNFLHNIELD